MDLGILAQQTFNGVMLGVIYAMIAVGFSLFFGVLDVINFSHGDVLTAGAFVSLAVIGSPARLDARTDSGVSAPSLAFCSRVAGWSIRV